tara:strand:+ start:62 stop:673 length:612 start_codon:yes stop_codon:yes gene_type:complete
MVKMTEKQQRDLLIAAGLADFATRGKITAVGFDALKSVVTRGGRALFAGSRRAAPSLGRFAGRSALRVAGTAGTIAMRHPILTAGAIIYVNRDQAAELLREGYDVVSSGISELDPREDVFQGLDVGPAPTAPKKKKVSKYNRAVAAGMKAAKASVSYGKKGTLSSPKKAFAAVNRTVSKVNQGKKVSNKGVIGKIARAARRFI